MRKSCKKAETPDLCFSERSSRFLDGDCLGRSITHHCLRTAVVKDEPVVFGQVYVEEERVRLDNADGDAGFFGQVPVALETVAAEGEGYCMARLEHERVGAAVTAGGDDDLGGTAAGRGHCAHIFGCQVGHVGGEDQDFGCAAGRGVAGSLGQGRVELRFRISVRLAGGRGRQTVRGRSAVGGWRGGWQTLFGQRMAACPFSHGQGVAVAADDNDLRVNLRRVDGGQGTGEEFAVEGVPLLGRDTGGQAAFAFVEGLGRERLPTGPNWYSRHSPFSCRSSFAVQPPLGRFWVKCRTSSARRRLEGRSVIMVSVVRVGRERRLCSARSCWSMTNPSSRPA